MDREPILHEGYLDELVAEFNDSDTAGFLLTGSHARGDANVNSDVDLIKFVSAVRAEKALVVYRKSHLVTISVTTVAAKLEEMTKPATAVWAVPGIRQARILADTDGSIARLKQAADEFDRQPLRSAADRHACKELAGLSEEVNKLLAAFRYGDEVTMLYPSLGLLLGLTAVIAVRFGVLFESENSYFDLVRKAANEDSAWSTLHREACGLDRPSSISERAASSLKLYIETASLLDEPDDPDISDVIDATAGSIRKSSIWVTR